ncbi:MAG: winged helix-turn-helix transcriptional regulator [Parcubacteria group bacterium]|nr:winged helix-turn-helix transcriptional regulator [Parcubacteria group bacterium]
MYKLEKILKALANRRRLAILKYLKENKEAPVTEIADEINLSFKATSKHLGVLSAVDIIEREQRSSQMFYHLSAEQKLPAKHIISIL